MHHAVVAKYDPAFADELLREAVVKEWRLAANSRF